MDTVVFLGLLIAMASAVMLNWAYVLEHGAASGLPSLSLRHPVRTVRLLLTSTAWLKGLAGEVGGFALYALALALAPLSLVQSVSAGGIAVLAYFSARHQRRAVQPRERLGVAISLLGLLALGVSLAGSTSDESHAEVLTTAIWLGASAVAALLLVLAARWLARGVAYAIAAGTLLGLGDVAVKSAYEGGTHLVFLGAGAAGYGVGTLLLQIAYQHTGALTAAGISTLLTNALPILAATTILGEEIPSGALGVLRVVAFVTVVAGAVALARGGPTPVAPAPAGRT